MSAPKRGDRVRVEFEGVVNGISFDSRVEDRRRTIWLDTATTQGGCFSVPLTACTVIAPPVKVGDVVTADNIGQLPPLSIVARPGYFPRTREDDGRWSVPGGEPCDDRFMTLDRVQPIVLRVGDGRS